MIKTGDDEEEVERAIVGCGISDGCRSSTVIFWIFVAPLGEIDNSVLVAYGETSTFAGALFGVDYTYRFKRYLNDNQKEEKKDE